MDVQNWYREDQEIKVDELELKKFEEFLAQAVKQNQNIKAIKEDLKEQNAILTSMKSKIMEMMDKMGKKSYKGDTGTFSIATKFSVKTPKEEDNKAKLFAWLQERGIDMQYLTVNSASLNSLYNSLLESEGETFSMPGIEPPKYYNEMRITAKK